MSNLRAYVMNSKVQGESFSEEVDGKGIRDTSVFTCEGQRFILQTKPEQLAEILVENVAPERVPATMEAIERICWLLALATQSQVACYGHNYPDGSPHKVLNSIHRPGQNADPVIDPADGAAIRKFVDQAYAQFKALGSPLAAIWTEQDQGPAAHRHPAPPEPSRATPWDTACARLRTNPQAGGWLTGREGFR